MDVILGIVLVLVVPGLIMSPYLVAANRFYRIVGEQGANRPTSPDPIRWVGPTMRDRLRVWSKAELGDFGPDASAALHSMRRRQAIGFVAVIAYWVALAAGRMR